MNEVQERSKADRGRRMRDICEGSGGLFEVIDAVARNYIATLLDTDVADTATREAIYHRQRALADIREVFRVGIVKGYEAEQLMAELSRREAAKQRKVRR